MKIPQNVKRILQGIINNEGGFQADPDDTGNYAGSRLVGTNYGITPGALAAYKGVDVSEISQSDIKGLTEQEAMEIYAQDYYYKPGYDKIQNDYLQENVVDMAVNAGAPRATRLLQSLAGVDEDGILGPQTLQAVNDSSINTNDYSTERKRYYLDLVVNDPVKSKYLLGWVNRANKYIVRDYPEEGVIPLDVMAQVDTEVGKSSTALPEASEISARAEPTLAPEEEVASLQFNADMFTSGPVVEEYADYTSVDNPFMNQKV